ncbi:MAG: Flp pilus assembly protein CpaB [Bdellovibrionota bacterium]
MENRRPFIISSICFLISIMLISAYVSVKRAELTADFGEEVSVVVANANIGEYATITPDMVRTITVFKKFRQPSTVTSAVDVVGKSTYVPIYADEQITLTKLIQQDGKPVLDRLVEQKNRAVTLLVAPHTGVGRLIRPGNRVDVMVVPSYEVKGETIYEVKTVVQNALVLATGRNIYNQVPSRIDREVLGYIKAEFDARRRKDYYGRSENLSTSRPTDAYSHITLQLNPDETEKILYLVNNYGDRALYFTLRNSADSAPVTVKTTLLDDVLGPDSDYAKSKRKSPPIVRPPPRFYDAIGGDLKGIR